MLNHPTNYVKRKDRLVLNQHITHTFPPPCSPEKTKSAFKVLTTLNLQGKKRVLCTKSSSGKSCNSNYRHCLPKQAICCGIYNSWKGSRQSRWKRRHTYLSNQSQAAQESCDAGLTRTGITSRLSRPPSACRNCQHSRSRGSSWVCSLFRSNGLTSPASRQPVTLSEPSAARAQQEKSHQDLIPHVRKLALQGQPEQPNLPTQRNFTNTSTANSSAHLSSKK